MLMQEFQDQVSTVVELGAEGVERKPIGDSLFFALAIPVAMTVAAFNVSNGPELCQTFGRHLAERGVALPGTYSEQSGCLVVTWRGTSSSVVGDENMPSAIQQAIDLALASGSVGTFWVTGE